MLADGAIFPCVYSVLIPCLVQFLPDDPRGEYAASGAPTILDGHGQTAAAEHILVPDSGEIQNCCERVFF